MDRHGQTRRRRKDAAVPVKPPIRKARERRDPIDPDEKRKDSREDREQEHNQDRGPPAEQPGHDRNISSATDSTRGIPATAAPPSIASSAFTKRDGASSRQTTREEENAFATRMTVTNVGTGGKLYLKPSRLAMANLMNLPASPPATSESGSLRPAGHDQGSRYRERSATESAANAFSMPDSLQLTRTRSQSFSEGGPDRMRSTDYANQEHQLIMRGQNTPRRSRSIADMHGLLDLQIPHYRIGSPRFDASGSAYIRESMRTVSVSSIGLASSGLSKADIDDVGRMFPTASDRSGMPSFAAAQSHSSPSSTFMHPMAAHLRSFAPSPVNQPRLFVAEDITPLVFDRLESNPNDPAVVHHHPLTGRILAATPARLIAQITSPTFLNYELLSDFFLTFRCFMPAHDVLEYLIARMKWAFANPSDAGRIVRVRTFVALRHWILNYYPDDFLLDMPFRERFCELINGLTRILRRRQDRGGSDMNIIGELKKCWQRTCELYWPTSDTQDITPDDVITPGGESRFTPFGPSVLSLPLTIRPATRGGSSVFEVAQVHVQDNQKRTIDQSPRGKLNGRDLRELQSQMLHRNGDIPTSPMSERSLEVLSCSVPFLSHMRSARELNSTSNNSSSYHHQHHRKGSYSTSRGPHSLATSTQGDGHDVQPFSGGLVRGILLEPCHSKVNLAVANSPELEARESISPLPQDLPPLERPHQHSSVKKIVGDMRRALSSRRAAYGEPAAVRSHRPTQSASDILNSASSSINDRRNVIASRHGVPPPAPVPPTRAAAADPLVPPRIDFLAERVEAAYHTAFEHVLESDSEDAQTRTPRAEHPDPLASFDLHDPFSKSTTTHHHHQHTRNISRVTNGSRSILIVDATGDAREYPIPSGAITSMSPLSSVVASASLSQPDSEPIIGTHRVQLSPLNSHLGGHQQQPPPHFDPHGGVHNWESSDVDLHDFLLVPGSLTSGTTTGSYLNDSRLPSTAFTNARKSSVIHPSALNFQTIPNPNANNLRRVPGGDLRAADTTTDLTTARDVHNDTSGHTSSTQSHSRSGHTSAMYISRHSSKDLNSSQILAARVAPTSARQSHQSQPAAGSPPSLMNVPAAANNIRPSFEADARRLRGIADSVAGGDGGIEDALAKLEGKIPSPVRGEFPPGITRASESGSDRAASPGVPRSRLGMVENVMAASPSSEEEKHAGGSGEIGVVHAGSEETAAADLVAQPRTSVTNTETQGASIYTVSESIGRSVPSREEWPLTSDMMPLPLDVGSTSPHSSIHMAARISQVLQDEPYSWRSSTPSRGAVSGVGESRVEGNDAQAKMRTSQPGRSAAIAEEEDEEAGREDGSDSENDDDEQSDISTEIADQPDEEPGAVQGLYFGGDTTEDRVRRYQEQVRKGTQARAPPTPPSTNISSVKTSAEQSAEQRNLAAKKSIPARLQHQQQQQHTLKESASAPGLWSPPPNRPLPDPPTTKPATRRPTTLPLTHQPITHMPFILAFPSSIIAEQLTIIEKDALDEVDWKDLITLNWQQNPPPIRNWVSYLKDSTSNGIDVVIARFNLVVKWVVSEILLTSSPSERARTIIKYIHIASHCHRLHNYASMYQITLALLSSDIIRLVHTWTLIPVHEKETLANLETLCQPIRNFNNLRIEMESLPPNAGCIPFIGLYTHDLMFNAQKVSRIDSMVGGREPLVNFERYQTAASIVKSLLRMIEASAKYDYKPHPEALSRCLWLAALEDREILARSKALETTSAV